MIIPLNRKLIVKQSEWEEETKDGIYLSKTTSDEPAFGIVVEKAEDCIIDRVKTGSKVYYDKFAGSPLTLGSEKFLILGEKDLAGVDRETV